VVILCQLSTNNAQLNHESNLSRPGHESRNSRRQQPATARAANANEPDVKIREHLKQLAQLAAAFGNGSRFF
jgi:hypothetical protein